MVMLLVMLLWHNVLVTHDGDAVNDDVTTT